MDVKGVSAHCDEMKPIYLHLVGAIAISAMLAIATRPQAEAQDFSESTQEDEHWLDAPQTPGHWMYREAADESFAEYVSPDGRLLVSINCSADHDIFIATASDNLNEGIMSIRTETQSRIFQADTREGWRQVALVPKDSLLEAMALSRGRFAIELEGQSTLYLPAWAEVTRVIEDCR